MMGQLNMLDLKPGDLIILDALGKLYMYICPSLNDYSFIFMAERHITHIPMHWTARVAARMEDAL